jgi:hypothetical protein
VRLTTGNGILELELAQPGLSDARSQQTSGDIWIAFRLQPYPEAGKQIAADEYRLFLAVRRLQ